MSDQVPEIEEDREIIRVRRVREKPKAPEKKNEEAEAAKARQVELEKRLRRLQVFLGGAIFSLFLLGLRALGCLSSAPSANVASPSTQSAVALPASPSPRSRSSAGSSQDFRRLFSDEPGVANGVGRSPASFEPSFADLPLASSNAARDFAPTLDDLRVVRIAAWNLEPFNFSKVNNATTGEKIARLFQEFDVVAVQGVRSKNRAVLEALVYLIARQGGKYDYVASPSPSSDSISALFFNTNNYR